MLGRLTEKKVQQVKEVHEARGDYFPPGRLYCRTLSFFDELRSKETFQFLTLQENGFCVRQVTLSGDDYSIAAIDHGLSFAKAIAALNDFEQSNLEAAQVTTGDSPKKERKTLGDEHYTTYLAARKLTVNREGQVCDLIDGHPIAAGKYDADIIQAALETPALPNAQNLSAFAQWFEVSATPGDLDRFFRETEDRKLFREKIAAYKNLMEKSFKILAVMHARLLPNLEQFSNYRNEDARHRDYYRTANDNGANGLWWMCDTMADLKSLVVEATNRKDRSIEIFDKLIDRSYKQVDILGAFVTSLLFRRAVQADCVERIWDPWVSVDAKGVPKFGEAAVQGKAQFDDKTVKKAIENIFAFMRENAADAMISDAQINWLEQAALQEGNIDDIRRSLQSIEDDMKAVYDWMVAVDKKVQNGASVREALRPEARFATRFLPELSGGDEGKKSEKPSP